MKLTLEDLSKSNNDNKRFIQLPVSTSDDNINNAINTEDLTIWFTAVSDDNAGMRESWSGVRYIEQIDVDTVNVDDFKLFAKDHTYSSDSIIGRIIETVKEDGKLKAKVKFSQTQDGRDIFQKYQESILTDVSIGYRYDLNDATILDNEIPLVILRNVEIFELSSVFKGFDHKAKIGRSKDGKIMEEELPTRVDDSLLPQVVEEEEIGCDAFVV